MSDIEIKIQNLGDALVKARKVLTDQPGWEDDPGMWEVIEQIDAAMGWLDSGVPEIAKGAYDQ